LDSMNTKAIIDQALAEVALCARLVSAARLLEAGRLIETSPRIFVAGAGRTGLCMRAFAIRLIHLGKTVYVVGETTTPAITAGDLLIIGSGSGQTAGLLALAEKARRLGVKTLLFTTAAASPLAAISDHLVIIPAPSLRETGVNRNSVTIQPLGSLFEQTLLMMCDSLILMLMQQTGVTVEEMLARHANLE
jgi:6-phospho-3-hexuloisomerase